jgi:hypothetical protein
VGHRLEAQRQRADRGRLGGVVLGDREGPVEQARLPADDRQRAEELRRAARDEQLRGRRAAGRAGIRAPAAVGARPVGQRARVGNEVEEVIGVHVGDHHAVDGGVVTHAAQLGEHAAAAVDQQAGAVVLDEVAAARAVDVLPCG